MVNITTMHTENKDLTRCIFGVFLWNSTKLFFRKDKGWNRKGKILFEFYHISFFNFRGKYPAMLLLNKEWRRYLLSSLWIVDKNKSIIYLDNWWICFPTIPTTINHLPGRGWVNISLTLAIFIKPSKFVQ